MITYLNTLKDMNAVIAYVNTLKGMNSVTAYIKGHECNDSFVNSLKEVQ